MLSEYLKKRFKMINLGAIRPLRYGFAFLACGSALLIKLSIHAINPVGVPLFFLAMVVSSAVGGRGPGFFAAFLCSIANLYFFVPPENSFLIQSLEGALQFGVFSIGAFIISSITSSLVESREKAYEAREEAMVYAKEKATFIANVTHEIRTPLNAIIGFADLLSENLRASDEGKEFVKKIHDSSRTLLAMVDDILDFSKLEFGTPQLEPVDFDFEDKIRQTISLVSHIAQSKGLNITCKIEPGIPRFLKGDASRISQVLLNLLSNAIKFTHQGHVGVVIKKLHEDKSDVFLKFEVTDTGIGIPQDARDAIFDSFVQGDASTTKKFGGTGLGLAICKRLMNLMGGEIGVESTHGKGSTFWFVLTLKKSLGIAAGVSGSEAEIRTGVSSPHSAALSKPRILVVEDNETNQLVATKLLEKIGYVVEVVGNGNDAILKVSETRYDAILMDCQMPGLDGYEVTRIIRSRESEAGGRVPIIAMTAYASPASQEKCKNVGMDDYLSKPVRLKDLEAILGFWIFSSDHDSDLGRDRGADFGSDNIGLTDGEPVNMFHLRRLRNQLEDGPRVMSDLINTFVEQTPKRIELLKSLAEKLAEKNEIELVKNVAHSLRSASGTLGAVNMTKICEALENLTDPSADNAVGALVMALNIEALRVIEKLKSDREICL